MLRTSNLRAFSESGASSYIAIYGCAFLLLLILVVATTAISRRSVENLSKLEKKERTLPLEYEAGPECLRNDTTTTTTTLEQYSSCSEDEFKLKERADVVLVGAGPGDPELLTVAAYKVLQEADLVIADVLVSDEIIRICKGKVVRSLKRKGVAHSAQDQLNQWMVDAARDGLYVCRLKGGDPFLFGRATEEIQYVLKHGFSVKVLPGISSSMCSSLASGIPITSRGLTDQICVATGHGRDDSFPNLPEYKSSRSYVFLMAVSRLESMSKALLSKGYPISLSVAIVEKATTEKQRVIKGTLENISAVAQRHEVESPATIVIGPTVSGIEWNRKASIVYESGGVSYSPSI